jgi:hypothetical protein
MRHALMYHGAYESNFPSLKSGATTYKATDGTAQPLPEWPGYMERAGKKFFAVRIQFDSQDLVLENPLVIDQMRHLGSRRLSPEPTLITDELASDVLDDAIALNPGQRNELAKLISRVNQIRREKRAEAT